jgi:hypothetical protein
MCVCVCVYVYIMIVSERARRVRWEIMRDLFQTSSYTYVHGCSRTAHRTYLFVSVRVLNKFVAAASARQKLIEIWYTSDVHVSRAKSVLTLYTYAKHARLRISRPVTMYVRVCVLFIQIIIAVVC